MKFLRIKDGIKKISEKKQADLHCLLTIRGPLMGNFYLTGLILFFILRYT